jgi:hypothetical protein
MIFKGTLIKYYHTDHSRSYDKIGIEYLKAHDLAFICDGCVCDGLTCCRSWKLIVKVCQ